MTLQWLLGWWNLIYLAPFAIAIVYLGVYVMTGIGFSEADADHGVESDHDADADHDLEADHDLDAGHDAGADLDADHDVTDELRWEPSSEVQADHDSDADHDADHDADADHDNEPSGAKAGGFGAMSLLHLIGFGKVPLSLMVMILLVTWGITGFSTNQLLRERYTNGDQLGLTSLPISAAIALVCTALLTRSLGRIMPKDEPSAMRLPQLVGQEGIAILPINEDFGLAKVHDGSGATMQVPCRVAPGQQAIPTNRSVVLMRFDRSERVFYVTTPDRMETLRASPARE